MELTNEEIARVFAMYFELVTYEWYTNPEDLNVAIVDGKTVKFISEGKHTGEPKMRLTPLSSITDEHAIEVCDIEFGKPERRTLELSDYIERGKEYAISDAFEYDIYQYLILKGYAVPLFFGVGHWANGKTAIELGIAIDKTKHP